MEEGGEALDGGRGGTGTACLSSLMGFPRLDLWRPQQQRRRVRVLRARRIHTLSFILPQGSNAPPMGRDGRLVAPYGAMWHPGSAFSSPLSWKVGGRLSAEEATDHLQGARCIQPETLPCRTVHQGCLWSTHPGFRIYTRPRLRGDRPGLRSPHPHPSQ